MISVAVRWYLRCGLSYRDVEELLAERGVSRAAEGTAAADARHQASPLSGKTQRNSALGTH